MYIYIYINVVHLVVVMCYALACVIIGHVVDVQIRDSIVVSISACHAEDPGSIPGRGVCPLCMRQNIRRRSRATASREGGRPHDMSRPTSSRRVSRRSWLSHALRAASSHHLVADMLWATIRASASDLTSAPLAILTPTHSGVAQWLACWAHNPKVRGSKPRSATIRQRAQGESCRSNCAVVSTSRLQARGPQIKPASRYFFERGQGKACYERSHLPSRSDAMTLCPSG